MPEIKKYLNRAGLEEYNSLLPHSRAEMQTYVNEWLDEHPEATTTVQDGAITEPKLADKSVSLRTLADDTVHMLKGAILTGNLSGEVLTADDAYSAPPMALTVDGKSTQDGTPTPGAPVEIVSVEYPELMFAGRNLLNLSNQFKGEYDVAIGMKFNMSIAPQYTSLSIADDGTMTITADSWKYTTFYTDVLPAGTYKLRMDKLTTSKGALRCSLYALAKDGTVVTKYNNTTQYPNGVTWIRTLTEAGRIALCVCIAGATGNITLGPLYVWSSAFNEAPYEPYQGSTVNLPVTLRSLTDGTKDTLALSYLRPSTREGWAWYNAEVTKRLGMLDMGALAWSVYSGTVYHANVAGKAIGNYNLLSTAYAVTTVGVAGMADGTIRGTSQANLVYARNDAAADAATMQAACAGETLLYQLATPITTQLDPIELPFTAAPNFTIWSDPGTGLTMEYVRDANIVIQNIEQAIADS